MKIRILFVNNLLLIALFVINEPYKKNFNKNNI